MIQDISLIEWLGYLGSVIVAVSLTMSSIVKLRWFNLLGAAVFSFYGFAIASLPVGLLNLFIVLADIYYLVKLYSYKESFRSISININDSYLKYFIKFHEEEIRNFFPQFKFTPEKTDKNTIVLLLLRNAVVAGVFIGTIQNKELSISLDYVISEFRDCKPGNFLYSKNLSFFKKKGIEILNCETSNTTHWKYLKKMGFIQKESGKHFYKEIE